MDSKKKPDIQKTFAEARCEMRIHIQFTNTNMNVLYTQYI